MLKTLIYGVFLLAGLELAGQDISALKTEAEKLEGNNLEAAFKKYQDILAAQPLNLNALCKSSEICSSLGHRQISKNSRLDYYQAGKRYAEIALRINPNYPDANFVMAVAMGRLAMVLGGRQKIEAVNDIHKYAEKAINLDPKNYKAFHVLGKWNYEVSSLNGMERTAARIFYGGLPPASISDAIRYYEISRSLNPDFNLNYLELAKAYLHIHQKEQARILLNHLMGMPLHLEDDGRVREEGQKLLQNLN
jgi:FimV-like protein